MVCSTITSVTMSLKFSFSSLTRDPIPARISKPAARAADSATIDACSRMRSSSLEQDMASNRRLDVTPKIDGIKKESPHWHATNETRIIFSCGIVKLR